MSLRVAIIYNRPVAGRYQRLGEGVAADGVMDAVVPLGRSLRELSHQVVAVPLMPPLSRAMAELSRLSVDVLFNLFEGFDCISGSEAAVAAVLETLGLRFTGSPSSTLRVCENKAMTKEVLRAHGIRTPKWQVVPRDGFKAFNLGFPCIVKPLREHASHGLSASSVVNDRAALEEQVNFVARAYGQPALVEEFLAGREFRALLVGDGHPTVLPLEEVLYTLPAGKPRLLTFAAKWVPGDEYFVGTGEQCPAALSLSSRHEIEEVAIRAFTALHCRGYASIDVREDSDGKPVVIDVNPNTDLSPGGSIKYPLEAAGIKYSVFVATLLNLAPKRGLDRGLGRTPGRGGDRQSTGLNGGRRARNRAGW